MKLTTNLLVLLFIVTSCIGPKSVSTIESVNYDDNANQTTFSNFPFGNLVLPGKWTKVSYNKVSGQHRFRNSDSIWCAVAINLASNYPFYKPKMTSNEIVKSMYVWDSNFWSQKINANTPILKNDTINHFIIWQINSDDKYKLDTYYLFGCENDIIFSIYVDTRKWDFNQKINFLQTVYKNKLVGTCCK